MDGNLASSHHLDASHGAREIVCIIVHEKNIVEAQLKLRANVWQPMLRAICNVVEDVRLLIGLCACPR